MSTGDPLSLSGVPDELLALILYEFKCPLRAYPRIILVARAWRRLCARPTRLPHAPRYLMHSSVPDAGDPPYHRPDWMLFDNVAPRRRVDAALQELGALGYTSLACFKLPCCVWQQVVLVFAATYADRSVRAFVCSLGDEQLAIADMRPTAVAQTSEAAPREPHQATLSVCVPRGRVGLRNVAPWFLNDTMFSRWRIVDSSDTACGHPYVFCLHTGQIRWRAAWMGEF
jgi:hypothetical protein